MLYYMLMTSYLSRRQSELQTYFWCLRAWTCVAVCGYQYKKSCCIRIGPRNDYVCANITTSQGYSLLWTNKIRYLGIYIVNSRQFRCSLDHAKVFFRSASAKSKCIPVLIYGLECFSLPKRDLKSLDFAVTRFLMKLFKSSNTEVIAKYQWYYVISLPSELREKKEK